ncbi:hypothetical protein ACIRD6_06850 [Streptomyces sp. NPDC102473]|uniref:hypothetical protein n=1 Tax=Streptomyces sp. NPDC102473 TaxID=3366180 RepID=UPI00381D7FB3
MTRFDAEARTCILGLPEESAQLPRGMGTICLRKGHVGRRLLARSLVGRVTEMLSFTPETRSNAAT